MRCLFGKRDVTHPGRSSSAPRLRSARTRHALQSAWAPGGHVHRGLPGRVSGALRRSGSANPPPCGSRPACRRIACRNAQQAASGGEGRTTVNSVQLIGNLTRDPERRKTSSETPRSSACGWRSTAAATRPATGSAAGLLRRDGVRPAGRRRDGVPGQGPQGRGVGPSGLPAVEGRGRLDPLQGRGHRKRGRVPHPRPSAAARTRRRRAPRSPPTRPSPPPRTAARAAATRSRSRSPPRHPSRSANRWARDLTVAGPPPTFPKPTESRMNRVVAVAQLALPAPALAPLPTSGPRPPVRADLAPRPAITNHRPAG